MALLFATIIAVGAAHGGGDAPAPRTSDGGGTRIGRVFVSGGGSGLDNLATPWPRRGLRWLVQSEAGAVASGRSQTDGTGMMPLRFDVPNVRSAVHLNLLVTPVDGAKGTNRGRPASSRLVDLVVIPSDVFAGFTKTLGALRPGLVQCQPLQAMLQRAGLTYTELDSDPARADFRGRVVVLGGLLAGDPGVTRTWIDSLPHPTSVIVLGNGPGGRSPLSAVMYLSAGPPPETTQALPTGKSEVWNELPADWFDTTCPRYRLCEPRWVTSLRVLAGRAASDGTVYPLVIESQDAGGRWWLVWNLPASLPPEDPRWALLLRNSLLWAHGRPPAGGPSPISSGGDGR